MVIGGLGQDVYQLATALAADGHEVVVLSRQPQWRPTRPHPTAEPASARAYGSSPPPRIRIEYDFGTDMMAWVRPWGTV